MGTIVFALVGLFSVSHNYDTIQRGRYETTAGVSAVISVQRFFFYFFIQEQLQFTIGSNVLPLHFMIVCTTYNR